MTIPRNDMRQAIHDMKPICPASKAMGAVPYACRKGNASCQCAKPQKPVVHYQETDGDFIMLGMPAMVRTVDHPHCSNTKYVLTTRVVEYDRESGEFETENTLYKPVK